MREGGSHTIVLLGRKDIQTGLLSDVLQSALQRPCSVLEDCLVLDAPVAVESGSCLLIDASCLSSESIAATLTRISRGQEGRVVALFNVDRSLPHDQWLAWPEVTGIFYSDTDQSELIEGLQAIVRGGYWLSRDLMFRYLQHNRAVSASPPQPLLSKLTGKEREVLEHMAAGHTNRAIAERLNVSYRTVKTHVYNIFKKLEVKNRVQAIARISRPAIIPGPRTSERTVARPAHPVSRIGPRRSQ